MNLKSIVLLLVIAFSVSPMAFSYDESCASEAQKLKYAAEEYESAKSSYEGACSPVWGYSQEDELACGQFGYKGSALKSAREDLEYAISRVASSCGTTSDTARVIRACKSIVAEIKKKLEMCEANLPLPKEKE